MSAAAIADPGVGSDLSMEADLGATLESAAESVMGSPEPAASVEPVQAEAEQAPPGEAGNGPSQPTAPPVETPGGEGPNSAAAPYQLTKDGAAYIVPKTELPQFQGAKQYADATQEFFPTAGDAKLGYLEASDFRALRSDFLSGDPNNIDAMLGYFSGKDHADPALAGQFRESFVRMAERIPETLKSINPDAHAKLGDSFINSRIESAYTRAAETGNPDDLLAAQRMDWGHTGRYKTELPKVDPQAAARSAEAARLKGIEDRETGIYNRDWKSFNTSTLEGPKWAAFNAEIEKTLAPVKDSYDPIVFKALTKQISDDLIGKLQGDYEWARNHKNELGMLQRDYQNLWKAQKPADGLKPRIETYTKDFMGRVRRYLPSIAAPILSKAPAKTQAGAQQQQKPKPQAANPQQPVARAADGKYLKQQPKFYDPIDDPEFQAAFNVN